MSWLVLSIVASVVLTVALNLAIRLFPGMADRGRRSLDDWVERQAVDRHPSDRGTTEPGRNSSVQVYFPWKAMLIGSLILTVALNLLLWIF